MNNNEEKNFKEYAKESTPDLWNKIENGLPEGMYTKDSSNEDNTTSDNNTDNNTDKKSIELRRNSLNMIKNQDVKPRVEELKNILKSFNN